MRILGDYGLDWAAAAAGTYFYGGAVLQAERSRGQSGTPGKLYSVTVAQNLSLVNFSGKILTFITLRERSSQ
jgi:hypothetical protein